VTELYRKWGRSVRREGARLVRLDEAGEAGRDAGLFRTRPVAEASDLDAPDADAVDAAAREIESIVSAPLVLERLFVSDANIAHECGGIRWTERVRRVHVAIARPPVRALVDLADFHFDVVRRIAEALRRAGGERDAPKRIRLAAHVGASLLPILDLPKTQKPAPHDGKGLPIESRRVDAGEPPNWFRPSYRLRPRRAWFHLRVETFGRIDEDAPEAIALLAPVGERMIGVLCADGGRIYPATIVLDRVLASRPSDVWYPYGAGAFGAELLF
jgi:hypothetical protein